MGKTPSGEQTACEQRDSKQAEAGRFFLFLFFREEGGREVGKEAPRLDVVFTMFCHFCEHFGSWFREDWRG